MDPYKIYYYVTKTGTNPIQEFLDSLSPREQTKILRIFQNIKTYGMISILPHTKKLTRTPLWEIRILGKDSIRILYLIPHAKTVLVLHGFKKKTQKTPIPEIQTALKRFDDYQTRVAIDK